MDQNLPFFLERKATHAQTAHHIIVNFYRPPSSDVAYFDAFCNAVESLNIVKYSNFILLGDFNIDFYNTGHHLMSRFN